MDQLVRLLRCYSIHGIAECMGEGNVDQVTQIKAGRREERGEKERGRGWRERERDGRVRGLQEEESKKEKRKKRKKKNRKR